jgi:hypothetical protein
MSLVNELIKGLLPEEEGKKTIGVFGGGFKPPTKGHFEVLKKALDENPEIDEMLVFIGKGERDGITQEESLKIWEIYGRYLPFKVQYIKSTKPPIQLIYNTAKENPESEVLWIIGAREENEDDFKDIASRTSGITKYPNLELRTIVTKGGVSGTAARNAAKVSKEKLDDFLPEFLSEKEKQDIFVMLSNTVTENTPEDGKSAPYGSGYKKLKENASYSQHIDLKKEIAKLTKHMLDKGMNILPLPKLVFKNGDSENAKQFLGKTAYYDPNSMSIVLYTEGRHPKDIVRSFSHEMVHHTQNLEGRLGDISTTNTMEDDHLDKLEQEANLTGTMTVRNWTDSLNENIFKKSTPQTKGYTLKTGEVITLKVDPSGLTYGSLNITAYDKDNNKIGAAYFNSDETNDPKILSSTDTSVKPDWRRKGVATAIYNFAKTFGYKIVKSTNQSPEGGKFTDSFNKNLNEVKKGVDNSIVAVLSRNGHQISLYDFKNKEPLGLINTYGNEVTGVVAKKGYGPLMYELGMANVYPNGLQSDRNGNTEPEAEAVLNKFIQGVSPNIKVEKLTLKDKEYRTEYPNGNEVWDIDGFYNHKFYNPNTSTLKNLLEKGNKLPPDEQKQIILSTEEMYDSAVNEAIVGEKIECDKCSWSWNIVDGGDDLFICHKCGHDNTLLQEKKTKDPFGINAYAMELGRLREEETEYKIYVDMDGVVADFDQRFRDLAGMGPREFEEKYGKNAFWDFIDEGDNKLVFWVGIPPMSDAKQLIDYVSKYDYEMLTAPSLKKQSLMGKGLWMKNQTNKGLFPSKPKVNYRSAKSKKDFAAPNHILIDDKASTIDSWNAAGGIGILHTSAANTINQLKKIKL